jgi:hypothetical protein
MSYAYEFLYVLQSYVQLRATGAVLDNQTSCRHNTPFGSEVRFVDRIFVVAEVDDTYVYHIHLGKCSIFAAILHIC